MIRYRHLVTACGVVALLSGVFAASADAQTTIRACANPAGQLRLIGATDSCRPQETLVTWAAGGTQGPAGPAGPQGLQGIQGPPGSDAEGVTGDSDRGPEVPGASVPLAAVSTPLTTGNVATGFAGYMVVANVALEFNSGNPATGTGPSPSGAGCSITYTVVGRAGTFFVDGRPVTFPVFAFGQSDRIVRIPVGLTGMVGKDLNPPLSPSETVDVILACNTPGFVPPPSGPQPIPVKAVNWSLSGIGVSRLFQE